MAAIERATWDAGGARIERGSAKATRRARAMNEAVRALFFRYGGAKMRTLFLCFARAVR